MILLRNFYVGITSWYRYVLDTLTGGNFLGTPTLEACTLIESLVRVPPIHVVKTEVTLEKVLEKLSSLEKSLPNIHDNTSRVNELIESIGKRITALEASTTLDSPNLRIGKLEESMETLSSIFSSLKFKKEKAFVGSLCLNHSMFLRLVRLLVQLRVTCRLNHLREPLKCLVW
jgi:DNA-directed RNA polymerase subunit H (RpoH/RPB5)